MLNSITIDGYYVSFAQHNPIGFNTGVTCITGRNGRGKCLRGTTALFNPLTGETSSLADLANKGSLDFHVQGYDKDMKLRPTRVVAAVSSGIKPLFRLRLANGFSVDCSETHPFLTSRGCLPLTAMVVGDLVAAPTHSKAPDIAVHEEGAETLLDWTSVGLLISDGNLATSGGVIGYTKGDDKAVGHLRAALHKIGLSLKPLTSKNPCSGQWRVAVDKRQLREAEVAFLARCTQLGLNLRDATPNASTIMRGGRPLGSAIARKVVDELSGDVLLCQLLPLFSPRERLHKFLEHLGLLGSYAKDKRVPSVVFKAPQASKISLLQGLFAGDGYISGGGEREVSYSSASKGLIDGLRTLLLTLEVPTKVRHRVVGSGFDSWEISPLGSDATLRLLQILRGLPHRRKAARVEALLTALEGAKAGYSSHDALPPELYMPAFWENPSGVRHSGRSLNYLEKHPQTKGNLAKVCEAFEAHGLEAPNPLRQLAESEVLWTKVVAIEPLGVSEETFDIEVDNETHLYCLDGAVTHNSSVLEMIRFALFGSAALRRPASDYKRLDVSLEFTLRGEDYRVVRSPRQVMLFKGDTPLATGSTPVNKAVVELFGYGLQVFDIANCCNQNQVMAFSDSMKPAERKRMIDQTVGLGAVDEVSEELNREALDLAKEVKFLTARWPEGAPTEPVKDVGFRPSEELRPLVGNVQNMVAELNQLRGKAAMPAPVEPAEPEVRNLLNSRDPVVLVKTMEDYADALPDLKAKASRFEYLTTCLATRQVPSVGEEPKAPKTLFHVEQLEASIAARNEARILRLQRRELQLPTMAPAEIEAANAALHLYNRVLAKRELLKQGTTECPNCHTSFPNAHSALDHYADVPDEMERPTWTADYLARQLFLQDNVQKADSLDEQILNKEHVLLEDDKELLAGVRAYEQAHRLWLSDKQRQEEVIAERGRWEEELKGFKWNPVTDYQSIQKAAADLKEDLNDLMRHEREVKDFRAAVAARAELEARLAELTSAEPEECLQALQGALESSLKYEADYQRYTKDFRQWEQDEAKIGELSATIQDLQAGVKALKELKARVKTHLLPSLNTVASLLVSEMTGGEISEIKLDEAFDISVNGTAIEALSGSGKAVANLALRLGLGQVLTNKVFSVFLGDELDASMDEHRAAYLMGCLHRLKGQVSQIVLVTHKPSLEADHYISL